MKNADIKAMSVENLRQQIATENRNAAKTQICHAVSPIENPMRLRVSRKLIARLNTALTAKANKA